MTTIKFDSALLIRREQGPDVVEISGAHSSEKVYCFQTDLPRGSGEDWLKELGFTEWVERAMGEIRSSKSGRVQPGMVDTAVVADVSGRNQRTIITRQAVGYVAPEPEEVN
jgi:hypothetical protein